MFKRAFHSQQQYLTCANKTSQKRIKSHLALEGLIYIFSNQELEIHREHVPRKTIRAGKMSIRNG